MKNVWLIATSLFFAAAGCGSDKSHESSLSAHEAYTWKSVGQKQIEHSFLASNGTKLTSAQEIFSKARKIRICASEGSFSKVSVLTCCGHELEGASFRMEDEHCGMLEPIVFANSKYKLEVLFSDGDKGSFSLSQ